MSGSRADDLKRRADLVNLVRQYGVELKRAGDEYRGHCPFHDDSTPSFTVFTAKGGHGRFQCFGCPAAGDAIDFIQRIEGLPDAAAAMDRLAETIGGEPIEQPAAAAAPPAKPKRDTKPGRELARYEYHGPTGDLLFTVVRRELLDAATSQPIPGKKTFMQQRADGAWTMAGVDRQLYRLPFVIAADTVWFVEGEKDVATLEGLGLVATTIPGGAKANWHQQYTDALRGKHVIVCGDTDKPGQEHVARVVHHLRPVAASIAICRLPDMVSDVTEFVDAGQGLAELQGLVEAFQVPDEPPPPAVAAADSTAGDRAGDRPASGSAAADKPKRGKPAAAKVAGYADSAPVGDWQRRLIRSGEGAPKALLANAITALEAAPEFADRLRWNEFALRPFFKGVTPWGRNCPDAECAWQEKDDNRFAEWLQHHGISVSPIIAGCAVQTVAQDHAFHPVREYLAGLEWDGFPRIDGWLPYYLGVKCDDFATAAGPRWLVSAVARIMEPGCKADCALVLEAPQGARKSTALRTMGHPWFTDELADMGSKDSAIQVAGAWIIEISELDAMKRTDIERVKSFMSRTTDRYRPPFERRVLEQPRQCVFAGTTNRETFLNDDTGNRRFWPFTVTSVRLDELERDRDQIWAEALVRYRDAAIWWLDTPELNKAAEEAQAARFVRDVWAELIEPWLDDPITRKPDVRIADILRECLKRDPAQWTQSDKIRVAAVLRSMGWKRFNAGGKGTSDWRYKRPED